MPKDACYRKVMRSYGKWSARAAQATAKCRKKKGKVKRKVLRKIIYRNKVSD